MAGELVQRAHWGDLQDMNFAGLVRLSFELDPDGAQVSPKAKAYTTGRDIKGRGEQTKDCQGYVESRSGSYVYTYEEPDTQHRPTAHLTIFGIMIPFPPLANSKEGCLMSRTVQVQLLDDIDGAKADETLQYGLDGTIYEIDLSAKHAEKLRASLARFVLKSRRVSRGRVAATARTRGGAAPARSDRAQNQAIRDWAKSKGIEVSDRGRIPASVVEQYQAEAGR